MKNALTPTAHYRDGADLMAQPTTLLRPPQARVVAAVPAARASWGQRLLSEARLMLWVLVRATAVELLFLTCACLVLAWSGGRARPWP